MTRLILYWLTAFEYMHVRPMAELTANKTHDDGRYWALRLAELENRFRLLRSEK